MDFSEIRELLRFRRWGKYVLTIALFVIVYLFVGNQSVMRYIERQREIRSIEKERDKYISASDSALSIMRSLDNKDTLERYAREKFMMHNDGEDVYLVDEK